MTQARKRMLIMVLAVVMGTVGAKALADQLFVTFSALPAFVQTKTAKTDNGTTVSVTLNAAPQASSFIYCNVAAGTANATFTAPTGFSTIVQPFTSGSITTAAYGKFAATGDPAGPFQFGVSGASTGIAAQCGEYSGVDTVTPVTGVSTDVAAGIPTGAQTLSVAPIIPSIAGTIPVASYSLSNETALSPGSGYLNGGTGSISTSGSAHPVTVAQFKRLLASNDTTTNVTGTATGTFATSASAGLTLVLLTHSGGLPTQPIVYVTPKPQVTVNPNVPRNQQIAIDQDIVNSCYHNSNPSCNGSTQPRPLAGPTASAAQVQSDYNILGKYVYSWQIDTRASQYAHNAGMKVYPYNDVFVLHYSSGTMPANAFPSSIIAKDTSGNLVYTPQINASTGGSYMGDLTSRGAGSLVEYFNSLINATIHAQYGPYDIDLARSDDSFLRWRSRTYTRYCAGYFNNGGVNAACPSSNPQLTATTWPELAGPPSPADEVAGAKYLFANAIRPVIANNCTDPTCSEIFTPNLFGMQCEACIVQQTLPTWINHMNAGLTLQTAGKLAQYFRAGPRNRQDSDFVVASLDLITQDPKLIAVQWDYQYAPSLNTPSRIPITPLQLIVPTQPIGPDISMDLNASSPDTYNPDNPPTTGVGVTKLVTATGAYAREYQQCYSAGIPIGPCAIVVNPDTVTHTHPTLTRTYTHAATYTGLGIISEFGDTGALNLSGPAAPSTLPSRSGYIELL